jgi:hypothetical protein
MNACHVSVRNNEFDIHEGGMLDTNDVNIAAILGARKHYWCGERNLEKFAPYDLIFFTMSKIKEGYEKSWMELVMLLRAKYGRTKKIIIYQEAEVDWPLTRPHQDQIELYRAIHECDVFFCHNFIDTGFYRMMCKVNVINVNTPMPIERVPYVPKENRNKEVIFGSSFDSRACGQLGLAVARSLSETGLASYKFVQYFRSEWKDDRNDRFRDFTGLQFESLPRLPWPQFVDRLSRAFMSMNLMPASAAGRDALVFAAAGVPHIGSNRLDTMQECFPKLCVDPLDCWEAYHTAWKLHHEPDFYDEVVQEARKNSRRFSMEGVKRSLELQLKPRGIVI